MTTVNSLSGGKTSSYLAVHYPADIDMFAAVCIDDHNANGGYWRKNKKLRQTIQDKFEKSCSYWPEFKATAEDPQTLITMLELEQKIGREITWVRGVGFEELIQNVKRAIPNISMRWCTTEMKIIPMFEYIYLYCDLPVEMRIGFRYDEPERTKDMDKTITFPISCNNYGTGRQKKVHDFYYRELSYPLIDDKIMRPMVNEYWDNNPDVTFPEDTGCQICFWKDAQQIKLNYDRPESKAIIQWAHIMEAMMNRRFKKDISMEAVRDIGLQMDFFSGVGPGCQAGICGI
jgi:hypothetical protein